MASAPREQLDLVTVNLHQSGHHSRMFIRPHPRTYGVALGLFQCADGGQSRRLAGTIFNRIGVILWRHLDPLQQDRQGHTGHHQRHNNHSRRQKDRQIPRREKRPVRHKER